MRQYYKKGSHNFECTACRGWFKADRKKIDPYTKAIVCDQCWEPLPWTVLKQPIIRENLPVKNPSPPMPYIDLDGNTDLTRFTTWDNCSYTWDEFFAIVGTGTGTWDEA